MPNTYLIDAQTAQIIREMCDTALKAHGAAALQATTHVLQKLNQPLQRQEQPAPEESDQDNG